MFLNLREMADNTGAIVPTDLDNPSLDTQIWYMEMANNIMGGIMPTAIVASLKAYREMLRDAAPAVKDTESGITDVEFEVDPLDELDAE